MFRVTVNGRDEYLSVAEVRAMVEPFREGEEAAFFDKLEDEGEVTFRGVRFAVLPMATGLSTTLH